MKPTYSDAGKLAWYTTEKGWRYVTSADRTPEVRLRIIAAFHTLY